MITVLDKRECCGCGACAQRCPHQCITMREDDEGFLYPYINHSLCKDCGLCNSVCPVLLQDKPLTPIKVYAARNKDIQEQMQSSSGGIFVHMAKNILRCGGVVFGAKYNSQWEVEHGYIEDITEIPVLMRSKYVQSRIGNAYKEVECFLKQGRKVLFVGVPCQVSGLKRFLRKEYGNLYLVDIICHGVPSPAVWRGYIKETVNTEELVDVNFRDKKGFSWQKYGMTFIHSNSKEGSTAKNNLFFKGYLHNLFLRPSCYSCPSKSSRSHADITIGDFWGVKKISRSLFDKKGVSMIILNSMHGLDILDNTQLIISETPIDTSLSLNPSYSTCPVSPTQRDSFFEDFISNKYTTCMSISRNLKHYSFMDRLFVVLNNLIKH